MSKLSKHKAILIGAAFVILAAAPLVINGNYYITILNQIVLNMIVVFGLNFITGLTGQMNLGTAGIYAIGAYLSAILSTRFGLPPLLTILIAIFAGFLVGRGLGYPSLRLRGVYLSLTTLAFTEIVRIFAMNLTDITGGTQGITDVPRFSIGPIALDTNVKYFYFVLIIAIIICLISIRIVYSKWGREFRAIRDNVDAIESLGLDVKKIKIRAFTLAAMYGTCAGALYVHFNQYVTSNTFTTDLSINYVIMMMIGGIADIFGNMIGTVVVTLLPELLRFLGDYYQITYYILVFLCAIFMPNGLVSIYATIKKKFRKRNAALEGGHENEQ